MAKDFFYRLLLNSCAIFFLVVGVVFAHVESEVSEGENNILAREIHNNYLDTFPYNYIVPPLTLLGFYFFASLIQFQKTESKIKAVRIFFIVYWPILTFSMIIYLMVNLDLFKNFLDYIF